MTDFQSLQGPAWINDKVIDSITSGNVILCEACYPACHAPSTKGVIEG